MIRDLYAADLIMKNKHLGVLPHWIYHTRYSVFHKLKKKETYIVPYWGMILVESRVKDIGIQMHVVYSKLYCQK